MSFPYRTVFVGSREKQLFLSPKTGWSENLFAKGQISWYIIVIKIGSVFIGSLTTVPLTIIRPLSL